jgi:type IV secretion system protein VirB8
MSSLAAPTGPTAARMAAVPGKPKDAPAGAPLPAATDPHRENEGWEVERHVQVVRSERRAWLIAGVMAVIALAAVASVAVLLKLQQVVAVPIVVDRATGEATVDKALAADTVPAYEALDKHNAVLFVLARERYNWSFLQGDYDTVAALSSPAAFNEYGSQFQGPTALQTKLGDATEWKVRVVNIRLEPQTKPGQAGVAVVTFVKQVISRDRGAEPEARYIATVAYEYHPKLKLKEKDRVANPFGFVVTAYRADPDINSVSGRAGP